MIPRERTADSPGVVLAIDAGGTYFKYALVNSRGEVLKNSFGREAVCSQGSKEDVLRAYARIICGFFEHPGGIKNNITGIGIATPGPFDYEKGVSLMSHKFPGIKGISLRDEIYSSGIFRKKPPIAFMHDSHAFLAGEHWTGAVRDTGNAAAVSLGTGLGFGIMKNGRILKNRAGGPRVSIFNRPCKDGTLEDIVSRRGIISRFRRYSREQEREVDVEDIAELALKKNVHAIRVFQETGDVLAGELSGIIMEYGVESVVFGGQISKSFDLFGPAFESGISSPGRKVRVMPGKNIDFSALTGAAGELLRAIADGKADF